MQGEGAKPGPAKKYRSHKREQPATGGYCSALEDEFAKAYLKTDSAYRAYNAARVALGKEPIDRTDASKRGTTMSCRPRVRARIASLQKALEKRILDTLEDLIGDLRYVIDEGKKTGDLNAITGAVRQISKMRGFDTADRKNERSPLEDLPHDRRQAAIAFLQDAIASGEDGVAGRTATH